MAKSQFQLRGVATNRIEAVSDVVFGFALTLLVVSLDAPHTYADLINTMRGFPAFALSFAALMLVWSRHYYFFRHYGLDDFTTIVLNTLLLFFVLFYIYPLKFLINVFVIPFWLPSSLTGMPMRVGNPTPGGLSPLMTWDDARGLEIIFGSGFAAVYFVFAALYWHAWRMRDALHLNPFEIAHTTTSMIAQALIGAVGLLSMLVAFILKPGLGGCAGYVYLLVFGVWLWRWRRRSLDRDPSLASLATASTAALAVTRND